MRSSALDIIRVLAIYLVIVVHFFDVSLLSTQYFGVELILFGVAKTCVPLFLLMSGGLLLGKKEDPKVFAKKRIKNLVLPWFAWSSLIIIISILFYSIPFELELVSSTLQSYWFVLLIGCLYILTPVLRPMLQATKNAEILYFLLLWFFAISFLPYTLDSLAFPLHVDNGLVRQTISYLGFYVAGYYLIQRKSSLLKARFRYWLGLFSIGIAITSVQTITNFFQTGELSDLYFNYFSPGQVITSVGLFIILLKLFKNIEKKLNKRSSHILAVISSLSLHVYFLHEILKRFIFSNWVSQNGIQAYWNALLMSFLCLAVLLIARQIVLLRKVSEA